MKILITSNSCWNLYNFRKDLISSLVKKYEIIIAAPYDKYLNKIVDSDIIFVNIFKKIKNHF